MIHIDAFGAEDGERIAAFAAFQKRLYENDPFFIPDETVILPGIDARYFLAKRGAEVLGRTAGLVNPLLTYKDRPAGMIGFFECVEDDAVAGALFSEVSNWLKAKNCAWCVGPMNGSTWRKYRVTLPDGTPPFFLDNHHKPWVQTFFESAGFTVAERYISTRIPLTESAGAGCESFEPVLAERGLRIRPVRMADYAADIGAIYDLSVEAFSRNAFYTPIGPEEFQQLYAKAAGVIDPQYVRLCEDDAGTLQGFVFALEDHFQPPGTALIVKTLAVRAGVKGKGLGSHLVKRLHRDAFEAGYRHIIHALMHEKNISTKVAGTGSEVIRRYHLYAKELG